MDVPGGSRNHRSFGDTDRGEVALMRYGDLELPSRAIQPLIAALEDMGELRLAHKLDRAHRENAELVLSVEDHVPILLVLTTTQIPELAEFVRVLEERAPATQQRTLRETRMAANEAFFRALNDRLERETHSVRPLIVLCECADEDCTQRIELTRAEYEETRSDPARFVVAPSHADPEIERVIDRTDRFEMVRKVGVGVEVVTRLENSKASP